MRAIAPAIGALHHNFVYQGQAQRLKSLEGIEELMGRHGVLSETIVKELKD